MFILYLLVGISAGFLAGLLGIGGGILFTPVLFYIFTSGHIENPVRWTVGSSMFCIFTASVSSIYRHYRQQNIYLSGGIRVGAAGVAGTLLGIRITRLPFYDKKFFVILFCALMLFSSVMFFWNNRFSYSPGKDPKTEHLTWLAALITGSVGGIVATLAGVGGGIVMVPLLTLLFHVDIHRTAGISSFAIAMITGVACLQYALMDNPAAGLSPVFYGYVDFGTAFPLALGGISGAVLGARLNHRFSRRLLQWIFALLALIVSIKLLYSNFF